MKVRHLERGELHVRIDVSHLGMVVHPTVLRFVGQEVSRELEVVG